MRAALASKLLAAAARTRSLPADDGGNVIVYVSLTAALLLGMVGLALDGGRAMITHSEAQAAADAAALAGASQLDQQSGACGRAQSEATAVVNQQRFAQSGAGNITLAAGGAVCLNGLPTSDSASTGGYVTTSDVASQYIQVTTQQLTHQNTFLNAVAPNNPTATIQRTAVAGFRRALCAASPVMMMCDTVSWTPGVVFDSWVNSGGSLKGFLTNCSNNSNTCVTNTLTSTTPAFCVTDAGQLSPAPGNRTTQAMDAINTRFGIGSTSSAPSDLDTVDFSNYSSEVTGASKAQNTGWNCQQYWSDKHGSDGLPKPTGCTTTSTYPTTRYAVYQAERAANKIPNTGSPNVGEERRLLYLGIYNCSGGTVPEAYLKTFMISPAQGAAQFHVYVEAVGIATSKTDPTAIHEEVQLYR